MDLLVSAMSGTVYCFATNAQNASSRAWPSQVHGRNGFAVREGLQDIFVTDSTRAHSDVSGSELALTFRIVDTRDLEHANYTVTVNLGGRQLMSRSYEEPGVYSERIKMLKKPGTHVLTVTMVNEKQQMFTDRYQVSMNMHFQKSIKYIVTAPFALMC